MGFNKTSFREPDAAKPRIVIAYSGGLDTSAQLSWLVNEKGFEVCAFIAQLGQEDLASQAAIDAVCEKAKVSGAYAFYCEDLREEFVRDYVFKSVMGNGVYEGRYLLGTCVARPCIAKRQIEICHAEGAKFVSHGCTGKGNDQVRFELAYTALDPTISCMPLWRDPEYIARFKGRQDLIAYVSQHGIPVSATKEHSYSEDENLMHISYESGELEDPAFPGVAGAYPGLVLRKKTVAVEAAPNSPTRLTIAFDKGVPTKLSEHDEAGAVVAETSGPLALYERLEALAGANAVGQLDIVENRFVGMKSRGCYETPAGTVLLAAHRDLELLTVDREVMHIRDSLALKYAELIYNGFWFSPEMDFVMHCMEKSQERVTGTVAVHLIKGNVQCRGRSSPYSLYNESIASMDEHGEFDPTTSTGFIQALGTRIRAYMAAPAPKE